MTTPQQPSRPHSRLDREIDEILERESNRPIPFQERVDQRRNAARQQRRHVAAAVRPLGGRIAALALRIPIVTALVLAGIGAWLAGPVPLLAVIFALAAIAMVLAPLVLRRPQTTPDQPRWRGRVVSNLSPAGGSSPRGFMDDIRRRLRR